MTAKRPKRGVLGRNATKRSASAAKAQQPSRTTRVPHIPSAPKITTSVLIRTPAPRTPPDAAGPITRLRDWQLDAVRELRVSSYRMLIAPTGSGKSIVVKALALADLTLGRKVIIAVPQLAIGHGYDDESIELDGLTRDWQPAHRIRTTDVRTIVRLLLDDVLGTTESSRTLVCTHQALVLAAEHPQVKEPRGELWKNVALFLDEAHHSLSSDQEHSPTASTPPLENSLGALVAHYLREKSGPLTLITATWMRTDEGAIVPRTQLPCFAKYVRSFDEHVKDLRHVRVLEIRFVVGTATDCLKTLLADRHPADAKTIVYQPAPGSDFLSEQGGKYEALAEYRKASGWLRKRIGQWDAHRFEGRPFTALELVIDGDYRAASLASLLEGIHAQRATREDPAVGKSLMGRTPDVIWALNMLREGSDYPALAHAILMAPRGSMLDTLQMFGRLLRDFPGKEHVQFDIVLPVSAARRTPRADQVASYLRTMMASVLVAWQFSGFRIDAGEVTAAQSEELASMDRADVQQQLTAAIVDAAIAIADVGQDAGLEADQIAERTVASCAATKGMTNASRTRIRNRVRQMLVGAGRTSLDFDVNMKEGLLGTLRSFSGQFGYADLRRLRESLGRAAHIRMEQVHNAMRTFEGLNSRWPNRKDGVVPDLGGSWLAIDEALRVGVRGLPGGSSLSKERLALIGSRSRKQLTAASVKDAILAHHAATGAWPNESTAGATPGVAHSWSYLRAVVRKGTLFPNGYTFSKLVRELRGLSPSKGKITIDSVEDAIRAFQVANDGKWSSLATKGAVPITSRDGPTLTWQTLDVYLARGLAGLPKVGDDGRPLTLAKVVARLRGVIAGSTSLTVGMVEQAMLTWRRNEGRWPTAKTPGNAPRIGVTWKALNIYLQRGKRGLPSKLTLKRVQDLLEKRKPLE